MLDSTTPGVAVSQTPQAFRWTCHEVERYARGPLWYAVMGAAFVGLMVYAIASRNFLFAGILLLAAIVTAVQSRQDRGVVEVRVADDGVHLAGRHYPWDALERFHLIYQPPVVKSLYLHTRRLMGSRVAVPLEEQNPVELRRFLLRYLPEDTTQEHEPLLDQILRLLKL